MLNRLDALVRGQGTPAEQQQGLLVGRYYLQTAARRIKGSLAALWDNDDEETTRIADRVLRGSDAPVVTEH